MRLRPAEERRKRRFDTGCRRAAARKEGAARSCVDSWGRRGGLGGRRGPGRVEDLSGRLSAVPLPGEAEREKRPNGGGVPAGFPAPHKVAPPFADTTSSLVV